MIDISSLPKKDLTEITNLELKDIIVTKRIFANSGKIILGHYIKIDNEELLVGNSKIEQKNDSLYFDFNPFAELVNDRVIIDEFYRGSAAFFKGDSENLVKMVSQKNSNDNLKEFTFISNIKQDQRAVWNIYFYTAPIPEGLVKGYNGKFDVLSHFQTLDYLKNNFKESVNKFVVTPINLDAHWKGTLKEMGMNVCKPGYGVGKFFGAHVDEHFNKYYIKTYAHLMDNGFI